MILLLCAGDKKSQSKDIVKAKKYFQDFKKQG
jgi:putative component of toxin-antitoxin plasmid stabilization module